MFHSGFRFCFYIIRDVAKCANAALSRDWSGRLPSDWCAYYRPTVRCNHAAPTYRSTPYHTKRTDRSQSSVLFVWSFLIAWSCLVNTAQSHMSSILTHGHMYTIKYNTYTHTTRNHSHIISSCLSLWSTTQSNYERLQTAVHSRIDSI